MNIHFLNIFSDIVGEGVNVDALIEADSKSQIDSW